MGLVFCIFGKGGTADGFLLFSNLFLYALELVNLNLTGMNATPGRLHRVVNGCGLIKANADYGRSACFPSRGAAFPIRISTSVIPIMITGHMV